MALDGSYDGLKTSIADFLNRGDLAAAIPDFIALAEAQMARRFVGRMRQGLPAPRRLIVRADTDIAAGTEYMPAPSDFHGPIEFVLDGEVVLDYLDSTNLAQQKQRGCVTGRPRWYALVGGELQLYPAADQGYAGELTYIARVPALSAQNPANWILTDYPDAYLKLVDDWKSAWKWLSMQFVAAAGTVQLTVLAFPETIRQYLPDWLTHLLAVVLLAAAVLGRLVDQKARA